MIIKGIPAYWKKPTTKGRNKSNLSALCLKLNLTFKEWNLRIQNVS
jgi:hypothetical protein